MAQVTAKLRELVDRIQPLTTWMKQHKPENKSIPVYKRDWIFLLKSPPDAIRAAGFDVTSEKGVTFDGFTLRPVDQKVESGK